MSAEPAAKPAAEKKKGGALKWVLVALAVLLLAGGGGGGYWYFVVRPQAAAAAHPSAAGGPAKAEEGHAQGGAALKFDPFVVNLADPGGVRYLRLGLSLVINATDKEAKHLEESKVPLLRIRSAVLDLLSQQLSEHVVTPEGKQELRQAIEERANAILKPVEVTDVLFTEFVVQF